MLRSQIFLVGIGSSFGSFFKMATASKQSTLIASEAEPTFGERAKLTAASIPKTQPSTTKKILRLVEIPYSGTIHRSDLHKPAATLVNRLLQVRHA